MRRLRSCGPAVFLMSALAFAQDDTFPASKHPWMKWKTGTSVKYKLVFEFSGQKQEAEMTYALTEVSKAGYTLKVTTKGTEDEERTEKDEAPVKSGQEKLIVEGKELSCTIWKSKGKRGDNPSETRFWLAEGVPVPVKITMKTEGDIEYEITATSLKEEVAVLGKKHVCVKLAGTLKTAGGDMDIAIWMTDKVPGPGVRLELKGGEGQLKGSMEITETQEKP